MHLTLRRTLFIVLTLAFVITGSFLIINTKGLVIDWENLRLVKTGSIYIRSFPPNGEILINGKPYKRQVSIFNRGTLIKDLLPKNYSISIKKEGRYAWEKTLSVSEGLVSSVSYIRLFEKEPEIKPISTRIVSDFWITRGGIIEKSTGKLYFGEQLIKGSEVIESSPEQNVIITKDEKENLFFIDTTTPKSALNISESFSSLLKSEGFLKTKRVIDFAYLHPFSSNTLIIKSGLTIFLADTKKLSLEKIMENEDDGYFLKDENEIFIITENEIKGYSLLLGNSFSYPFKSKGILYTTTNRAGTLFFIIDGNNNLILYDRTYATSSKITENAEKIILSPDEEKALILKKNDQFAIYYLKDDSGDVKTEKGALKLLSLSKNFKKQNISSITWTPDIYNYFLFLLDDDIAISEADIRSPANSSILIEDVLKFIYHKKLYILGGEGTLYSTSFEF